MRAYKNSPTNKESKDARVHCAVLNVRPTTDHPTPPDLPRTLRRPQRYEIQTGPDNKTTTPTPDEHPLGRARSLRTQQRAYEPATHPPHAFHTPEGAVLTAADRAGRTGQRSTLEHHPGDSRTPRT